MWIYLFDTWSFDTPLDENTKKICKKHINNLLFPQKYSIINSVNDNAFLYFGVKKEKDHEFRRGVTEEIILEVCLAVCSGPMDICAVYHGGWDVCGQGCVGGGFISC